MVFMKEQVEQLILKTKNKLEINNQSVKNAGNRPRYPMILFYNDAFTQEKYLSIKDRIKKIWPGSVNHLLNYRYNNDSQSGFVLKKFESEIPVDENSVRLSMDDVQKNDNAFGGMEKWLIYNIIDTTEIESVQEFEKQYSILNYIVNMTDDQVQSMVIVLLNESSVKRGVAKEIREFLSRRSDYNSNIIISTRTKTNRMFDISQLYRLVSNILVLSCNDTVNSNTTDDYVKRSNILYSNNETFTVSYVLCEKPNRKISIQINEMILDGIREYANKIVFKKPGVFEWKKMLAFENDEFQVAEKYMKQITLNDFIGLFQYLPMKSMPEKRDVSIESLSYKEFCNKYYASSLENYIDNVMTPKILNSLNFGLCVSEFKEYICKNVSLYELKDLSDSITEEIFAVSALSNNNSGISVKDYCINKIVYNIKKDYLYPEFKKVLKGLRENSIEVEKIIYSLYDEMSSYSVAGDSELGDIYKNRVSIYLSANLEDGHKWTKKICNPANSAKEILSEISNCADDIIDSNREFFSMPYIEDWEARLGEKGDKIYNSINSTLTGNRDDHIHLYGHFISKNLLNVYLLHTGNADGTQKTKLYEHISQATREEQDNQYFNTGYDDAVEVISFISCKDINLV